MTLHRRLLFINVALVAGLALMGGAMLWGLRGLHRTIDETASEHAELRIVETATLKVSAARIALLAGPGAPVDPSAELRAAASALREFESFQELERDGRLEHHAEELADAERALAAVESAASDIAAGRSTSALDNVDRALLDLRRLEELTDVSSAVSEAHARMSRTMLLAALAAGGMIAGAVVASILGHRAIMRPLRRLQAGVRTLASGRLEERVVVDAAPELAELAEDFNQMASELEGLHRSLESKVATKSRELSRSERLASVGYLAAGVAHEINNPLGILSGYAELCRRWLGDGSSLPSPKALADVRHAANVIAEEAQRCKEITGKLLSMARMGDGPRDPVSLARVARDVAEMLGGLLRQRRVELVVRCDPDTETRVVVNPAEIRQIVLNLLVNALEALPRTGDGLDCAAGVRRERGRIELSVGHDDGRVELAVVDNGCGMSADVLARVFEPFFTAREGGGEGAAPRRGVGLGLSISHAIAESHGGTLRASSEGPGRGSRFVLSLPAAPAAGVETRSGHSGARSSHAA